MNDKDKSVHGPGPIKSVDFGKNRITINTECLKYRKLTWTLINSISSSFLIWARALRLHGINFSLSMKVIRQDSAVLQNVLDHPETEQGKYRKVTGKR
jgi:hypothetical protein